MMVMTDLEDPFVPLSEGLFVDPYESKCAYIHSSHFLALTMTRDVIKSLLTQLPHLFSRVKNPEPSLLSSMTAAVAALASTGGKIICSLSALPTWGPGRLFLRDDNTQHHSEAEKKLFKTEHPGYTRLATKMVESGIGVDFFLAAAGGGYLDIATIGMILNFLARNTLLTKYS
jgi:protein transport protein SEC24